MKSTITILLIIFTFAYNSNSQITVYYFQPYPDSYFDVSLSLKRLNNCIINSNEIVDEHISRSYQSDNAKVMDWMRPTLKKRLILLRNIIQELVDNNTTKISTQSEYTKLTIESDIFYKTEIYINDDFTLIKSGRTRTVLYNSNLDYMDYSCAYRGDNYGAPHFRNIYGPDDEQQLYYDELETIRRNHRLKN